MGFWRRVVLLVMVSSMALGAWPVQAGAPDAAAPTVLVEALVGRIQKLNPLLATYNPVDRDITTLIFEGLTTTNQFGEIVPQLAASWTVSDDGLQYFVELREDVVWQDGIPFTAEDVVFTVQVMSSPQFPGAATLYEFWRTVEADALGDHLVRFRLTQPLASFPDQLRVGIVPAHVLRGVPASELAQHPFNLSPIGTGPYQIETLTASDGQIDGIQLRTAPVYRQRPEGQDGYQLDRIVFRTYSSAEAALDAYRQGEVNSIGAIPPDLLPVAGQVPGLSLYTTTRPRVGMVIYNWDRVPYISNPRVRLALAHAVDRDALVAQTMPGSALPADSPLLPHSWAYAPDVAWPITDLGLAQGMLDTANISLEPPPDDAGNGEPTPAPDGDDAATAEPTPEPQAPDQLALTILTLDDPPMVALAEGVAASWEQIGFVMAVEAVDAASLQARLEAGEFEAALVEYSFAPFADPDPYVFWHQGQQLDGLNYGGMTDLRTSEALEQARRDPVGVNRAIHYRRFQELFAERALALPLYYPLYIYGADARLEGVQLGFLSTPSDRFRTLQDWHFRAD